MGARAIDYDRGVTIKSCDKPTCFPVYMYKDTPGVYLNVYGQPVSEDNAKEAGYDVDALRKQKEFRERSAVALEEIRAQLEMEASGNDKVVMERGGLKIVTFGHHYHVKDQHDNVISPIPLPLDQATLLLDKLAPKPEKPEKKPSAREKAQKEAEND